MMTTDGDFCDNDLHVAVRLGDLEATKKALESGLHPDVIGLFEWTAVHEASFNGEVEILKLLLKFGANPNKHDNLNASTALHYASAEGHADCLDALLKKGGDAKIKNNKKETCITLATSAACQKVLEKHGLACEIKPIKSILKSKKAKPQIENGTIAETESKTQISSSPKKSKPTRFMIEPHSFMDSDGRVSSPASTDSGTFSPSLKNYLSMKDSWDGAGVPSSPARSLGSSYGSLTSLGSSGCSAADDCAGEFLLSFQYNSKKEEFKIRIWEILLLTLLQPSRMPKDTNMYLYVKSEIIPDDQFEPNPLLKRKSDAFRLQSGENIMSETENQCPIKVSWLDKEARIEFKNSLALEYNDITKKVSTSSAVKICLCIRRKKLFMSKNKHNFNDPVLASVELRMSDAVKKIMKEAYSTDRHDVLGVTRQAFPLDVVVADKYAYDNKSYNSDPSVQIRMSSILTHKSNSNSSESTKPLRRSSSIGDLDKLKHHISPNRMQASSETDMSSEDRPSTESDNVSSLDSVHSHTPPSNPQVKVRLPLKKQTNQLDSVEVQRYVDNSNNSNSGSVKVSIPHGNNSLYREFKAKQTNNRGRILQKTKSRVRSSGKLVTSTTSSLVIPNRTPVDILDQEERSMGSPSEEEHARNPLTFEERLKATPPQRSGSLLEVDESPSPSRHRRHFKATNSPLPKSHPSPGQKSSPRPREWVLNIDPTGAAVDIELLKNGQNRSTTRDKRRSHPRTSNSKHAVDSAARRLIFDESNSIESAAVENPNYVNDEKV